MELIVGTLRQFRFETGDVAPFVLASRQLGPELFAPPNVKGWPGGEAWINSATLLARKQLLERLFRAQEPRLAADADDTNGGRGRLDAAKARERLTRAMLAIRYRRGQMARAVPRGRTAAHESGAGERARECAGRGGAGRRLPCASWCSTPRIS